MTLNEALKKLKSLGNEATRMHNAKNGAGDNQFGVKHGDIRVLAKTIGPNHELAMALWKTGNLDARYLAILLIKPTGLFAQKELAHRLQDALDRLPFDQRTAIVLREIDGLSYEEISFTLGVAIGTVKSRLTRAPQALREELAEDRIA